MSWLLIYLIAGIVCAEGYIVGCRRLKVESDRYEYLIGIFLWPLTLLVVILGVGRKR